MDNDNKILKIRQRLRLSQVDLATLIGVAQGNYSAIEAGKKNVSRRVMERYVSNLKVSEAYLLRGVEPIFRVDIPLYSDRTKRVMELAEITNQMLQKTVKPDVYKLFIAMMENKFVPEPDFFFDLFARYKDIVNFDFLIDGTGEPLKKAATQGERVKPWFYETYKDDLPTVNEESNFYREAIIAYRIALSEKERTIEMLKAEIQTLKEKINGKE